MSASATSASGPDLAGIICDLYRPLRCAEKLLARDASATPRAARNWLRLSCQPRVEHVLSIAAKNPEFRRRLLEALAVTRGDLPP